MEYYGGIKGIIVGIGYQVQLGFKNIDNLVLFQFINLLDSIVCFDVVYDIVSIFIIKGMVVVLFFEGLEIMGLVS